MRRALIILTAAGLAQAQQAPTSYIGAGGCNSSNCHGAAAELALADSRIKGNEYATWANADKHARAYRVLLETRGKRMAEILKITDAGHDKRCVNCHVVGSPEKSINDGVACEACHGPAEKWLGPHSVKKDGVSPDVRHKENVANGMIDTKDLPVRADTCLKCHVGDENHVVDHDLIAAGHPDLAFELETFTEAQPAHHRQKPAAIRIRAWAVGETAALGKAMGLIAMHAPKNWPEFSDMECYQCHHDLRSDSWRIARGYGSRRPGSLQLNGSRIEVVKALVSVAASEERGALDAALVRLGANVMDAAATAQAAGAVEAIAKRLTARFQNQDIDAAAVLRAVSANIQRIADDGVNAAEQATMTLDALGAALGRNPDATKPLYDYLEHPSAYRPGEFVGLYQRAGM
jgi:hypothetical protein